MKQVNVARNLAGAFGRVAGPLVVVYGLVKTLVGLPMKMIEASSSGSAFFKRRFDERMTTNKERNAQMLAGMPGRETLEMLIIEGSAKLPGDEDLTIPFPKGFLASIGLRDGQRVTKCAAADASRKFLAALEVKQLLDEIIESITGKEASITVKTS